MSTPGRKIFNTYLSLVLASIALVSYRAEARVSLESLERTQDELQDLVVRRQKGLGVESAQEESRLLPRHPVYFNAVKTKTNHLLEELIKDKRTLSVTESRMNSTEAEIKALKKKSANPKNYSDSRQLAKDQTISREKVNLLAELRAKKLELKEKIKTAEKRLEKQKKELIPFKKELSQRDLKLGYRFRTSLKDALYLNNPGPNAYQSLDEGMKEFKDTINQSKLRMSCLDRLVAKLPPSLRARNFMEKKDAHEVSPLMELALQPVGADPFLQARQTKLVSILIQDAGVRLNDKDAAGNTALMVLARSGNLSAVKTMINAGANLEARNELGQTALMVVLQEIYKQVENFGVDSTPEKQRVAAYLISKSSPQALDSMQKSLKKNWKIDPIAYFTGQSVLFEASIDPGLIPNAFERNPPASRWTQARQNVSKSWAGFKNSVKGSWAAYKMKEKRNRSKNSLRWPRIELHVWLQRKQSILIL